MVHNVCTHKLRPIRKKIKPAYCIAIYKVSTTELTYRPTKIAST